MGKNIDVTNTIAKVQAEHPELLVYIEDDNKNAKNHLKEEANSMNEKSADEGNKSDQVYHKPQPDTNEPKESDDKNECPEACGCCSKGPDEDDSEGFKCDGDCKNCECGGCMDDEESKFFILMKALEAMNANIVALGNYIKEKSESPVSTGATTLKSCKMKNVTKKQLKKMEKRINRKIKDERKFIVKHINVKFSQLVQSMFRGQDILGVHPGLISDGRNYIQRKENKK